jgi:hypothetical protein
MDTFTFTLDFLSFTDTPEDAFPAAADTDPGALDDIGALVDAEHSGSKTGWAMCVVA